MTDVVKYFHVDMTHGDYAVAVAECETEHKTSHPLTTLSVNAHQDGTEAVIKVCCTDEAWTAARSWANSPAVIAAYDGSEINSVRAIVNAVGWYPDPLG